MNLTAPAKAETALPKRTLEYLAHGAPEGQRNEELLQASAQFRDAGCCQSEAESQLLPRAIRDGLTEREALQTIRSAFSKSPRTPITTSSGSSTTARREVTPEERARIEAAKAKMRLVAKAQVAREQILVAHNVGAADYAEASPDYLFGSDTQDDWRLLLRLFAPDDVIWIGESPKESAGQDADAARKEYCATRFRRASDWLKESSAPGLFTCPSTFKSGSHSRCNDNAVHRRFLVVESDTLDRDQVCAVFHWIEQFTKLRAIVDTAGRSLHGWFEVPPDSTMDELKIILPVFGCDPALFKQAQPCRLPGAVRTDRESKIQSLLYLDLKGTR